MAEKKLDKHKVKSILVGDYDYKYLCMPSWPYCRTEKRRPPQFFSKDANLGVLTAMVMGLQHTLAMTAGLITPPILIGSMSTDPTVKTYLIQASMLVCGITTLVQVAGIRIPKTPWRLGAGILSVMGVSFASLPVFQASISNMMKEGKTFNEAYGAMLGSTAICAVLPIILSFFPYKVLRHVFPPVVTGTTVILIGIKLTSSGFKNWGGGVFCGENYNHFPTPTANCTIPLANGTTVTSSCYNAETAPNCSGNGDVYLPFGSAEYVGMGFLVFSIIIILEIFGSPFMRNAAVIIALLLGYLIAALVPSMSTGESFVNTTSIQNAPVVTFLWTTTFPLGIYAPAMLPLIIVFCITSIETIGDVTATEEASRLTMADGAHSVRVKGGLLNDGVSGAFSALAGSMPLTTFAQNNGVIALTNVASRQAGFACAGWLFLLGIFAKFGGWVLSIPNCVLGGMTTFLFANVISSGIKILVAENSLKRRERFILACALALGIGVSLVPQWATNNLWPENPDYSEGVQSIQTAVIIILSTGFTLGAIVAIILNLIVPHDNDHHDDIEVHDSPTMHPVRTPDLSLDGHLDASDPLAPVSSAPKMVHMAKDVEV